MKFNNSPEYFESTCWHVPV